MSKLRLTVLLSGAFLAGIAFVMACNGNGGMIDAGFDARAQDAAGPCAMCEMPLTADRFYQAGTTIREEPPGGLFGSWAECLPGDMVLGGGCVASALTESPVGFGPSTTTNDRQAYGCRYNDPGTPGFSVEATATCFRIASAQ